MSGTHERARARERKVKLEISITGNIIVDNRPAEVSFSEGVLRLDFGQADASLSDVRRWCQRLEGSDRVRQPPPQSTGNEWWVRVEEAAELADITKSRMYQLMHRGKVRYMRSRQGRCQYLIDAHSLEGIE